jgi:hypothetical protein
MNYVYYVLEIRAWGRHPKGVSKAWCWWGGNTGSKWYTHAPALAMFKRAYLPKKYELRLVQITEIN